MCIVVLSYLVFLFAFTFCRLSDLVMLCSFFFFFKQKTAYEMRISDWSSDVCSSDLRAYPSAACAHGGIRHADPRRRQVRRAGGVPPGRGRQPQADRKSVV